MSTTSPIIRTVCGDIEPSQLGVCYGHEHLLGQPPAQFATPDLTLDDKQMALAELQHFQQAGGRAVVEMTTPDYGRDAAGLHWLSEQSGIKIIAATGYNKEKFSAPFLESATVQQLTAHFVCEVTIGMDGTAIKAGLIKASSTLNHISPLAEKLFQAAAQAHRATGAPISTHTEAGTMALEQIDLLVNAGVQPQHIIIGHLDRLLDWELHLKVARAGVYLGYDQISKEKYYPDGLRAEFIQRLFAAGHGRQILLSGDLARRSYWHSYTQGAVLGFQYILTRFTHLLTACGLSAEDAQAMLIDNPAQALSFVPRENSDGIAASQ